MQFCGHVSFITTYTAFLVTYIADEWNNNTKQTAEYGIVHTGKLVVAFHLAVILYWLSAATHYFVEDNPQDWKWREVVLQILNCVNAALCFCALIMTLLVSVSFFLISQDIHSPLHCVAITPVNFVFVIAILWILATSVRFISGDFCFG